MRGDIISQLPDEILTSIISKIPTKEAVCTSILSKRWRNLHRFLQRLNICAQNRDFCFPSHLLSLMPFLQYLKLSFVTLQLSLKNPCNALKKIHLSHSTLSPGSLECILSNCFSLHKLIVEQCSVHSTLCFPRLHLQLKCFVIWHCEGLEEICFYAPNLEIFDLMCKTLVNLKFEYVPQLRFVRLISQFVDVPYFWERLRKNVPTLDTLIMKGIRDRYQKAIIAKGINMFDNLKRLELSVCDYQYNLFSLIRVVHGCLRLEEFLLAKMVYNYIEWPEEGNKVNFHSRLKVVEISGFVGSESEFAFISYILKCAVELQQMVISRGMLVSQDERYGKRKNPTHWTLPLYGNSEWGQLCERIQQIKYGAVSKTLQVVVEKFPHTNSIKFEVY